MDFVYWWSFSSGGSAINGATHLVFCRDSYANPPIFFSSPLTKSPMPSLKPVLGLLRLHTADHTWNNFKSNRGLMYNKCVLDLLGMTQGPLYVVFASNLLVWMHWNEVAHHFDCLTTQNLGEHSNYSKWENLSNFDCVSPTQLLVFWATVSLYSGPAY